MTFMCAACLLATVVASQDGRRRWWLFAALLAGLAGSTKWNGLAVAPRPVRGLPRDPVQQRRVRSRSSAIRCRTRWSRRRWWGSSSRRRRSCWHRPRSCRSSRSQRISTRSPDPRQTAGHHRVQHQLTGRVPRPAAGLVCGRTGRACCLGRRDPARRGAMTIPVFIVVYFVLASLPPRYYARNLLPLIPFAAVAGGVAVGTVVEWLGRQAWVSRLPPRSGVAIVVLGGRRQPRHPG